MRLPLSGIGANPVLVVGNSGVDTGGGVIATASPRNDTNQDFAAAASGGDEGTLSVKKCF